jgi:GntR family histidine utilization transcriptional repressor
MAQPVTWQTIQNEALRRIREREWKPGEMIPHEAALAEELGCARATVNRALRELAAAGFLERRRKAGTRVALNPVRKATFDIPIIRHDVEGRGAAHGYRLLERKEAEAPAGVTAMLRQPARTRLVHVAALHLADGAPFCVEDRWINPQAVPTLGEADFSGLSANEWLVQNVTLSGGSIAFFALPADARLAALLGCSAGAALFRVERTTWAGAVPITAVTLTYAPGYRMTTAI